MVLPVRKIRPVPNPIKTPAKIADTRGSPRDGAKSSVK